jgi:hypothetical protein
VTLNGTIDPEGSGKPVDYLFKYGTAPGALSAQAPTAAALSGATGEEYHVDNPETAAIPLASLSAGAITTTRSSRSTSTTTVRYTNSQAPRRRSRQPPVADPRISPSLPRSNRHLHPPPRLRLLW